MSTLNGSKWIKGLAIEKKLGDFSSDELLAAAIQVLPALAPRFQRTATAALSAPPNDALVADLILPRTNNIVMERAVDPNVFEALHHPAMWRTFWKLAPDQYERTLDGSAAGLAALASAFTNWFCVKARRRGSDLTIDDLVAILQSVARQAAQTNVFWQPRQRWIIWACASHIVGEREAGRLYQEASLAGLIWQNNNNQWSWRHTFVGTYLAELVDP
jgi:hypothetical protein